ncbi:MAG: DUF6265 family protein [Bacteroidota bacterium]
MKIFLPAVLLLCLFVLVPAQTTTDKAIEKFKKLEWLIGTWNRTNVKPGRSGVEVWKKISNTELHGWGISMKGNDTTFVEKLKIVMQEDDLYYVADVQENKGLVYFNFTQLTDHGFTCENGKHDFPTKIQYEATGLKLKAAISGNGRMIEYFFEREK